MAVLTTLNFAGRNEEALAFYRAALDAETVFLMRFSESPDQSYTQPGMEDLIFHATFRIDDCQSDSSAGIVVPSRNSLKNLQHHLGQEVGA